MKLLYKLAVTATASALALTACGSDSTPEGDTGGASNAASPAVPAPQVPCDIPEINWTIPHSTLTRLKVKSPS